MANVVREDVVQISFDVDNKPLEDLANNNLAASLTNAADTCDNLSVGIADANKQAEELNSSLNETSNASKGLDIGAAAADNLKGSVEGVSEGLENMASGAESASAAIDFIENNIAQFDERMSTTKSGLSDFKQKLLDIASVSLDKISHPITTIESALGSAKDAASGFVTKLKDIGKQQLNTLTSNLKSVKSALTEGETGASGLVTALKNIGKISIASAANGLKNIGDYAQTGANKLKELAKTSFSSLKSSLSDIPSKLKEIGSSAVDAAGKLAKITLKGLGVAAGAGAAALSAAVTGAVTSYADYEQLVGGVETLFGAGGRSLDEYASSVGKTAAEVESEYNSLLAAQETVLNNAANAYKTAGLSANDYMDTVTGFSASLISSLGGDTEKAADLANQALVDMSDNANKMGTDMESIQNAYQGFAKQNYTMLDNLKLGYGGTQSEMQRLLEDAQKISGIQYDISSFADITEAIHVIQTEMDITGTTAKEAEGTISGSLGMLKASWSNLLTGLVTGGDNLDICIDNLVSSAQAFASNIMPAIQSALSGVGQLIEGLAPMIGQVLPALVSDLLPTLTSSVVLLLESLVTALADNAAVLADGLAEVLKYAVKGITTIVPELLSTILSVAESLSASLSAALPDIIGDILDGIVTLLTNAPSMIQSGMNIILSIAEGIVNSIPTLISHIPEIISALVTGIISLLPQIIDMGIRLLTSLASGLLQAIPQLIACIPQIIAAIWDGITNVNWLDLGKQIILGIWDGIKSLSSSIWNGIKSIFTGGDTSDLDTAASNIGSGYAQSLSAGVSSTSIDTTSISRGLDVDLSAQGTQSASTWCTGFSSNLATESTGLTEMTEGLATSASVDLTEQGTSSAQTWSTGFNNELSAEGASLSETAELIKTELNIDLTTEGSNSALTWNSSFTNGLTKGMKTALSIISKGGNDINRIVKQNIQSFNSTLSSGVKTAVTTAQNGASSIKSAFNGINLNSIGQNMIQGLINGINSKKTLLVSTVKSLATSANTAFKETEDINSPSKVWESYGEDLPEGLNIGITKNISDSEDTAEYLANIYTPERDSVIYNKSSSSNSETNTYAPVFKLTISGSNSDRELARKVKRWIKEAIQEEDESIARRNPQLQTI